MKGRITKIEREDTTVFGLVTGVKENEQGFYDDNPRFKGGRGTYSHPVHSEHAINLYLTIFGKTPADNKRVVMDIRNDVLAANGLQRISKQKFDELVKNNVGHKVDFEINDDNVRFKPGQLNL